jgi:molybdopterin synthase sulfur carrier subunit
MIRVVLPAHLRTLARVDGEVRLAVEGPVTPRSVLDALEARYPMLRGTIRDHITQQRRAFLRFFACEQDLSLEPPDTPLPDAVATGAEPFLIVGAMAGGSYIGGVSEDPPDHPQVAAAEPPLEVPLRGAQPDAPTRESPWWGGLGGSGTRRSRPRLVGADHLARRVGHPAAPGHSNRFLHWLPRRGRTPGAEIRLHAPSSRGRPLLRAAHPIQRPGPRCSAFLLA